jgi:hypothetical protein
MAGEANVKLSRSMSVGGRVIGGVDELVPAAIQEAYEETVTNGSVDHLVDISFTVANALAQAVHSSQQIEVHCNHPSTSTTTHQSLAVAKNVAQLWTTNEPTTGKVFTADVTALYITNLSGTDAKVDVGVALPD